jgi:hypothetical protein
MGKHKGRFSSIFKTKDVLWEKDRFTLVVSIRLAIYTITIRPRSYFLIWSASFPACKFVHFMFPSMFLPSVNLVLYSAVLFSAKTLVLSHFSLLLSVHHSSENWTCVLQFSYTVVIFRPTLKTGKAIDFGGKKRVKYDIFGWNRSTVFTGELVRK